MQKYFKGKIASVIELLISTYLVISDFFLPTLTVLGVTSISLIARREKISSLGFSKIKKTVIMFLQIFGIMFVWTLFHLCVTMPILNRLTGTTQDISMYLDLKGNIKKMLILVGFSWTLAAFGEEIVYRGFFQKKLLEIFGSTKTAVIISVIVSSILFGIAHTEQGIIGIILTFLDAVVYSLLKLKYKNLWASVFAHGLSNTIGIVGFTIFGPTTGLW